VLHLKDLHCTKTVQNRRISTGGNGLSHLLDLLCPNGAGRCRRKDLEESSDEKKGGRISEKGQYPSDEIGTGRSTRDARSGHGFLKDARLGGRLTWLASSSYKSVARPALTVNKYYDIDIIRMEREGVEMFVGYKFEG
jgi:hypothetical protein